MFPETQTQPITTKYRLRQKTRLVKERLYNDAAFKHQPTKEEPIIIRLPKFNVDDGFTIGLAVTLHLLFPEPQLLRLKTQDNQLWQLVDVVNRTDLVVRYLPSEDYELFCDWRELIQLCPINTQPVKFKRYTFALANAQNTDWVVCHSDDPKTLDGVEVACHWMRRPKSDAIMRLYDGDRALW